MRDIDDGGQNSSNMDPRHGPSDKARWETAAMEAQGGGRGSEKWGDSSNQTVAGGAAGGRQHDLRQQQAAYQAQERRHPTPGKRNASPLVGGAEVCVTCKETGHLPVCCPRAICGRCGNHGHLVPICNTVLPWDCVAPMCGFQARGKGFFYIHDHSTPNQNTDRNRFIVISVVEGHASGRQLEEFFNAYINTNWKCSARSIGPNTFVMRFPSPRDVDKACFAESMNVKSCGAVINLRKWSESVGAKGILNVAWVNISNIPLDKRHEKNIAYVGSLVGVTLEIDKATINRPESVRIKLGCRDAEDIPASAEGVLGGHFYDFFFSVDKILVKNPPREKVNVQQKADGGTSPKRARFNEDKRPEGQIASSSTMEESSAPPSAAGGRNVKNLNMEPLEEAEEEEKTHNNSEEIQSEEESEEVDNELLIDTMAAEAEKNQLKEKENRSPEVISYDKIVVNSMQIVPSPVTGKIFSSYLEACVGEPIVTELDPDDNSCQQKNQNYSVQSPVTSNENMDVIPTPPAVEEVQIRFSKRTAGVNMEHVGIRAEKMAKKRNLQGLQKPGMVEVTKKGAEMLKENASQMLLLCGPPIPEANDHADGGEEWEKW